MSFNLENGENNKEINETLKEKTNTERLAETEQTAENFDDCSLYEIQNRREDETGEAILEDTPEDYDDCKIIIEKSEEKHPNEEEEDDFSDCIKESVNLSDRQIIEQIKKDKTDESVTSETTESARLDEKDFSELQDRIEEKNNTEAKMKLKFEEVLSKEKGSDEYRQSLQEYNALREQKLKMDEQIAELEKKQEGSDKKGDELGDSHPQKDSETIVSQLTRQEQSQVSTEKLETDREQEPKENPDNNMRPEDDYQRYKKQLAETDEKNQETPIEHEEAMAEKRIADEDTRISANQRKSEDNFRRSFITNGGEKITYQEAVKRITDNAEKYMTSMGVESEKQKTVTENIRAELFKQQLEAEKRALGDHGIRHIYGNYERGETYLNSRENISDEQKLAILVAQVYHDEGYTVAPANLGTLDKENSAKKHDEYSLLQWEGNKKNYDFFTSNTLASIDKAIGEHNIAADSKLMENEDGIAYKQNPDDDILGGINGIDRLKENTSNKVDNIIVSTVHISDKLALSEREKFSELLSNDPKMIELTEGMNSLMVTLQDRRLGFYENGELSESGKELLNKYHKEINEYIGKKGYDEEYADRLKKAVEKDVGFDSGKFSSSMNYIYTPPNCYQYNPENGNNEIKVYMIERDSDVRSKDLAEKQVGKMLKDFGLSQEEIETAMKEKCYNDTDRGLSIQIGTITDDEIKQIESERFQENNDIKEANECIEMGRQCFDKLRRELTEIAVAQNQDITYDTFINIAHMAKIKVKVFEDEFKQYSSENKKQLINDAITKMVISNTNNIFNN